MENTNLPDNEIILKEYGRNIQKIVNYLLRIEDKEKRSRLARTLIELMKQINPNMRDAQQDVNMKLWDHLFIMSQFKLDVDSPFPKPEPSMFKKKPQIVEYNLHNLKFKHYGRNIELLVSKAIELKDPTEREAAIIYLGRLMKRFYTAWNKENIDDEIIVEQINILSEYKLKIDLEKVKAGGLFDSNPRERERDNRDRENRDRERERDNSDRRNYGNGGFNRNKKNGKDHNKRKRI